MLTADYRTASLVVFRRALSAANWLGRTICESLTEVGLGVHPECEESLGRSYVIYAERAGL